ncbi:hypothetical protein ACLM45_11180 [Synechococcus sp. A10-1-5-9]|uniref:hypothetical protein n=1 Tax=Synechococcus sp. A10-1-5-9 TaxID=3392295 RepID=UPI0039EB431D
MAFLAVGISTMAIEARAGLLEPLLQLMRPRVEQQLAGECQRIAKRAIGRIDISSLPLGELISGIDETVLQPCRDLALPASECLIREASRSGRELGIVSELISGRVGDDTQVVVKRCLASLLGLPATGLQDLPLKDLMLRLRR